MKVLWLSHLIPYPPKGGVLQRSYNMVREMAREHEITLVAFNQKNFLEKSLPGDKFPVDTARKALSEFVELPVILDIPEDTLRLGRYRVALNALLRGEAYNMAWLKSPEASKAISALLSQNEFDVVHVDTISLCVYFDLLKGHKIVLNHHNFESEMLRSRADMESNWLKRLYYKVESARLQRCERDYCQRADLNLACSQDDADAMEESLGVSNFLSIPNGVDESYFYPREDVDRSEQSIVIVGGLSWYPNREAVEYFLHDIWPLIKQNFPEMRVDIVGRDPTEEMKKCAQQDSSVFFHGFVDDVREYLWRSHFYLCPIRTGGGTKLKILDALATGCCIIADPFACKGISVRDGEHLLFANTPEDYVANIRRLLEDSAEENLLRESGPRLIQAKYSYRSIGRLYSESLSDLIGSDLTPAAMEDGSREGLPADVGSSGT